MKQKADIKNCGDRPAGNFQKVEVLQQFCSQALSMAGKIGFAGLRPPRAPIWTARHGRPEATQVRAVRATGGWSRGPVCAGVLWYRRRQRQVLRAKACGPRSRSHRSLPQGLPSPGTRGAQRCAPERQRRGCAGRAECLPLWRLWRPLNDLTTMLPAVLSAPPTHLACTCPPVTCGRAFVPGRGSSGLSASPHPCALRCTSQWSIANLRSKVTLELT